MPKHLTQHERYYIWQRLSIGDKISTIAKDVGVHRTTIHKELKRNKNEDGKYLPGTAELKAIQRRADAKSKFSQFTSQVIEYIKTGLTKLWSPEQLSGRMPKEIKLKISHETIYQYIKKDKAEGGQLFKLLPHKGKKYNYHNSKKVKIPGRVDISLRPKIVEKKQRIGDFEGDTIVGARGESKECLLTLVDRKSKFVFIAKTPNRSALSIQQAIESLYDNSTIPFETITTDNGKEFCKHQEIAKNIGCSFYFARPYKSCDRDLNEHTNGLIRRVFPKKTDFSTISDEEVIRVQNLLNNKPRKILGSVRIFVCDGFFITLNAKNCTIKTIKLSFN